jgi:hypothetical protein
MTTVMKNRKPTAGYGGGVAASRPKALAMVARGEAILALLSCVEGILPSNRVQDARDTQGRDALATREAIAKLRLTMPPSKGVV